jgi:hypothetical protein
MLVAIVADDDEADAVTGGPHFAAANTAVAPVVPPGMPEVTSRNRPEPITAPGSFRAAWEQPAQMKQRQALRRPRNRRWVRRACVVAVVCAAGYAASPRVHSWIVARSVAPDLRGYVQGSGVTHAPTAEGYSVRLPKPPVIAAPSIASASTAAPIVMHTAVAVGRDYRIAVWNTTLPAGALPKGTRGALQDPKIGGAGPFAEVQSAVIADETASVGTFTSSDALPRRVAVLVHGGRLFVIRVQAESAGTVFDAVVRSFRFTR